MREAPDWIELGIIQCGFSDGAEQKRKVISSQRASMLVAGRLRGHCRGARPDDDDEPADLSRAFDHRQRARRLSGCEASAELGILRPSPFKGLACNSLGELDFWAMRGHGSAICKILPRLYFRR